MAETPGSRAAPDAAATAATGVEVVEEVAVVEGATFEASLPRRLGAEFLGTLMLVAVGTGAVTAYVRALVTGPATLAEQFPAELQQIPEQLEVFEVLLSSSLSDLVPIALAFAFVLALVVYAFGGVSGGHFNPAVTIVLTAGRRFPWRDAIPYVLAQVLGGIAGALVVAGIFWDEGAVVSGQQLLYGATTVVDGVEWWQALIAEIFIGFVLMMAIMAVAVDPRAPKGWSGVIIGLALAAGILVTGFVTGGSANFARSFGPFVASSVASSLGVEGLEIPWGDLVYYAFGPLIGATIAAFTYEAIAGLERVAPAPSPGAATTLEADEVIEIVPDESSSAEGTQTREPPRP